MQSDLGRELMDGGAGRLRGGVSKSAVAVLLVVAGLAAGIVVRDFVEGQRFDAGILCQRADGSHWRTASGCDPGNDPACRSAECSSSTFVAERPREADTWLLFGYQVPASGDPPLFDGPHPGSGRYIGD
jgi:hypothetical protein